MAQRFGDRFGPRIQEKSTRLEFRNSFLYRSQLSKRFSLLLCLQTVLNSEFDTELSK
jgi:hypothetical protein